MIKLSEFAEKNNFLQTDFAVLLRLSKREKSLSELISETLYTRETVNTILKRLLDLGEVYREKTKNGKYVYSASNKLDINDEQYAILDYLMDNYKNIMTPNACRIICVLVDDAKFAIKDLLIKGWLSSALYKNIKKLEENKIIYRDGDYYKLSPEIQEAAFNNDINKKTSIANFNFNDYSRSEEDKEERIDKLKNFIKGKSIVAIQDFIAGKDLKWLKKFEDNYKVFLPKNFNIENDYEKMINILLISKKSYENYESFKLEEDGIFSLRYIYGRLSLKNGKKIRILNLYIPQSYKISEKRNSEIKRFWHIVIKEVLRCRKINEEFIILGDLNAFDGNGAENKESFLRLNDIMIDVFEDIILEKPELGWGEEVQRRLDYIFVNSNVIYNNTIECKVDDSVLNVISDHKLLQIELRVKIQEYE